MNNILVYRHRTLVRKLNGMYKNTTTFKYLENG